MGAFQTTLMRKVHLKHSAPQAEIHISYSLALPEHGVRSVIVYSRLDSGRSRQDIFILLLLDHLCSLIVVLRSLIVLENTGLHSPLKPVILLQIYTLFFSISIHSLHFLLV